MERAILRARVRFLAAGLAMLGVVACRGVARGYSPESREVKELVNRAVQYLEKEGHSDRRAGAQALVGIALLKAGKSPSHPRVIQAANEIQRRLARPADPAELKLDDSKQIQIYSASLCVIFLSMLDPVRYGPEVQTLLRYLQAAQKPHGGWGYPNKETGDTSMTQNAVLCCWEARDAGFRIPVDMLDRVAVWLLRTQDPSGGFGYQGTLGEGFELVSQNDIKPSMSAAGLGSLYILAEMFSVKEQPKADDDLPPALRKVERKETGRLRSRVDPGRIVAALGRGKGWWQKNYVIDQRHSNLYYLYALERYQTFREKAEGRVGTQARWYDDGVRWLAKTQKADGSWTSESGSVPATGFGILFLVRSTKKSIEKKQSFGDGSLIVGHTLPKYSAGAAIVDGNVVGKRELGELDQILAALDDSKSPDSTEALQALALLPSDAASELISKHAKRLRALAGDESAEARLAAVRALAKDRDLDNVPTLIYALTDPVRAIQLEARDALRRISRKFRGFGLPDDFSKAELDAAIKKWEAWYRAIRPDAELEE